MEAALAEVDKVGAYKDLTSRETLTLRLLTEETMAMMRAIAGNLNGEFWIEDQDGVYELHLRVRTLVDASVREQLLAAASSGENEANRGFMGKIRAFFEPVGGVNMFSGGYLGSGTQMNDNFFWTMEDYRDQLREYNRENGGKGAEAWDELEKSVVAKIADNVTVSIRGFQVEMTIFKKLA